MNNSVPSIEDWGDYKSDLDMMYAFEHFYGRSRESMYKDFNDGILMRVTDLSFMPIIPFRYYMIGFKNYIEQKKYDEFEAPDVANGFLSLVEEKLREAPEYILPIANDFMALLEDLVFHQEHFDVDVSIYGDFMEKFPLTKELLAAKK